MNLRMSSPIAVAARPLGPMGARPTARPQRVLGSYKKGGKVKKTGLYKMHKGEKVIPLSKLKSNG